MSPQDVNLDSSLETMIIEPDGDVTQRAIEPLGKCVWATHLPDRRHPIASDRHRMAVGGHRMACATGPDSQRTESAMGTERNCNVWAAQSLLRCGERMPSASGFETRRRWSGWFQPSDTFTRSQGMSRCARSTRWAHRFTSIPTTAPVPVEIADGQSLRGEMRKRAIQSSSLNLSTVSCACFRIWDRVERLID